MSVATASRRESRTTIKLSRQRDSVCRSRLRLVHGHDALALVLERCAEVAPTALLALALRRGRATRSHPGQLHLIAALVCPHERPFAHGEIAAGRLTDEVANAVDDLLAFENRAGGAERVGVERRNA